MWWIIVMRSFLTAILCTLLCSAASAQAAGPVKVELSLPAGKTTFLSGELIQLNLQFSATAPGYSLNTLDAEPGSPIDEVIFSPMTGVFPWVEDAARGKGYGPGAAAVLDLTQNAPVTIPVPLNAAYRFDRPGHYILHVVTSRVLGFTLTSNDVSFDIEMMTDAEDAARAASLEQQIRSATDESDAQSLAKQLDWLAGDASTRTKISLFLHPKEFYPFGIDVSPGLWIARNRALVVAELERAIADPKQSGARLISLAVAMEAGMQVPFNPAAPAEPLPTAQIEDEYFNQLAKSLPQRTGEPLLSAALAVFGRYAARKETTADAYIAAREVVITHFSEVNEYNLEGLLNSFGDYLKDERTVPVIEHILRTQHDPTAISQSDAAMAQLIKIAPQDLRSFVVDAICTPNSIKPETLQKAPLGTLPETDACLAEQIHSASPNPKTARVLLQNKAKLAANFATNTIYDDLYTLYETSSATWNAQTRGAFLAYFMRWDTARGRPLLEAALPANADKFDLNITFTLYKAYYSAGLNDFLRERLTSGSPGQAESAAYGMSGFGPAENQEILRQRLDRWRADWTNKDIPAAEGKLEMQLVLSVISGKHWRLPDAEADALRQSCISAACRTQFRIGQ
jgi:hypothetical protein